MPKTRPAYPSAYRDQIIALARSSRSPENLAAEFEPSARTIRTWINQAKIDSGQHEGITSNDDPPAGCPRRFRC